MGQLFSDIASLADFLIHKSDKSKTADVESQSGCGFGDWLSFSIINNKNCRCNDITNAGSPTSRLADPIDDSINLFEQTAHSNTAHLPAETYSYRTLSADELRDLVNSQAISLTLDLKKSEELYDLSGKVFSEDNVGQNAELLLNNQYKHPAGTTELEVTAYDGLRKGVPYSFDNFRLLNETSRYLKLTFMFDKLFGHNDQSVPVKIVADGDNVFNNDIPAEKLKELLEKYPDRVLIEVKTTGKDETSINDNKLFSQSTNPSDRINQQNKYIIFDLKALLIQKDSEYQLDIQKIKVIEKTVITDTQTALGQTNIENIVEESAGNNQTTVFKNNHQGKMHKTKQASTNRLKTQIFSGSDKLINTTFIPIKNISQSARPQEMVEYVISRQYPGIKFNIMPDLVGDKLPAENWTSSIAVENIDKIINQLRSRLMVIPGSTQMTIRLKPEHLGRLTISLIYDGKKLEALFKVECLEVKRILEAEMPRLKTELGIDDCKVETALKDFDQDFNPSSNGHLHSKTTGVPYHYLSSIDESDGEDNDKDDKRGIGYSGKYHGGKIDLFV